MAETQGHTEPAEVNAIAGKLLALAAEHISVSEDVLIAALKVAANVVEETKNANFSATVRAGIAHQFRGKR